MPSRSRLCLRRGYSFDRSRFGPVEVIEFPTVLVDAVSLQVIEEFRVYVRPVRNPALTPFCTSLTGIEQVGAHSAWACWFVRIPCA